MQLGQLSVIRARHDNIWVTHCQTGQRVAAVTRGLTQQCGGGVGQHHHWHSLRFAHPKRVAETGAEDRFAVETMLKHAQRHEARRLRRLEFKDILIQEKVRPHDPRTLKVKSEDRFDEGQRKVVVGEGHQRLIERLPPRILWQPAVRWQAQWWSRRRARWQRTELQHAINSKCVGKIVEVSAMAGMASFEFANTRRCVRGDGSDEAAELELDGGARGMLVAVRDETAERRSENRDSTRRSRQHRR